MRQKTCAGWKNEGRNTVKDLKISGRNEGESEQKELR